MGRLGELHGALAQLLLGGQEAVECVLWLRSQDTHLAPNAVGKLKRDTPQRQLQTPKPRKILQPYVSRKTSELRNLTG